MTARWTMLRWPALMLAAEAGARAISRWLPYSDRAVAQVASTPVYETGGRDMVRQIARYDAHGEPVWGPARSPWQIEPATADDIYFRWAPARQGCQAAIDRLLVDVVAPRPRGLMPSLDEVMRAIAASHQVAACFARIRYGMAPDPFPALDDDAGRARLWKRVYNSSAGAGSDAEGMERWQAFIASAGPPPWRN